ncbi:GPI mannosyltransferase 2 [Scaptodrosophila lebanonensis]|uniref:GPI mannosyltransferase 2 n=1 Tax=Drosophila lebanonensis TaxID=7225 RepID=A0A6J2U9Y3_DROLE|nr:GPI mannosyltransferase 2 [Scaptodrosophila lebanonensis]
MTLKVTKLALTSRVIVLVVQMLANWAITDHKPDVFRMPLSYKYGPFPWLDKLILRCLGGLRHWDGEYFLHIANYLYSYENTLAFYPLYPVAVRHLAEACHIMIPLSLQTLTLIMAVILNVIVFCKAANLLYQLTHKLFNDFNKSWNAALIYCFNPATIFFSAAYSETLFSYVSFYVMLECVKSKQEFSYLRLCGGLTACFVCRSNGLLALGFPLYFLGRHFVLGQERDRIKQIAKLLLTILLALIILHAYYFYIYRLYCLPNVQVRHAQQVVDYANERNYLLSGQGPARSPWCEYTLPFPYTYVQSHYWDVGFLRYYEWKQLPNFLLALPMLLFMHLHCYEYFWCLIRHVYPKSENWKNFIRIHKALPFVMHAFLLTLVCTFFVHIQVSTRLIASASPVFYWFAADHMPKTLAELSIRSKAGMLFMWCASYALMGTILFSNNFPWT